MGTVNLAEDLLDDLRNIQGKDVQEKISRLIENNIRLQLKECEEFLFRLESKYGMDFESFANAWKTDEIERRHSHEVERDFMEWEGFSLERLQLLASLRKIRIRRGH